MKYYNIAIKLKRAKGVPDGHAAFNILYDNFEQALKDVNKIVERDKICFECRGRICMGTTRDYFPEAINIHDGTTGDYIRTAHKFRSESDEAWTEAQGELAYAGGDDESFDDADERDKRDEKYKEFYK